MIKFYKVLFFNTLIFGTLISISSYSWMSMWLGLEINLMSMIPLLKDSKSLFPSESAMKYFITQTLASTLLLFSITMALNLNEWLNLNPNIMMIMMNSALLTKTGAAPFHSWFPEVMEGLGWTNCLILLTWQKIAPLILVMFNYKMTLFLSLIIMASILIGSINGLNQISLRKIMAYSSINHMGWMIAGMLNFQSIWLIYFAIYSIITINIILIFEFFNILYLNQLFNSMNTNKNLKMFFLLNFMSLGGLPPFLGFLPKWLTINNLIINNFYMLSLMMIIITLITLFFYLRITFSTLTIKLNENLMFQQQKNKIMIPITNFISLTGLLWCSLIFNLF